MLKHQEITVQVEPGPDYPSIFSRILVPNFKPVDSTAFKLYSYDFETGSEFREFAETLLAIDDIFCKFLPCEANAQNPQ